MHQLLRNIIFLTPIFCLTALPSGQATPVKRLCPEGDTCVLIQPNAAIKMATLLDNTTINPATGSPAVDPTNGIDDRRGIEVARILRPTALGHDIELVGPDSLDGLPNYRENCNDLGAFEHNDVQMDAIISEGDIVAILGLVCSNSGAVAAPIGTAAKHLIVSSNNQSPALTDPANRPADSFYYRTATNGKYAGAAMATFAQGEGFITAAAISDGSIFSDGVANAFRNAFGNNTPLYSPTLTDQQIINNVGAIIAAGAPDIIYVTNTSVVVTQKIVVEIRKHQDPNDPNMQELINTKVAASNVAGSSGFWAPPLGLGADGVVISAISLLFHNEPDYIEDFLPEYKLLSGGVDPINAFHGYSFDAYNIVVDALEKVAIPVNPPANGANRKYLIPRQALRDALEDTENVDGLTTGGNTGLVGLTCNGSSGYDVGDCTDSAHGFIVKELDCSGEAPNTVCTLVDPS